MRLRSIVSVCIVMLITFGLGDQKEEHTRVQTDWSWDIGEASMSLKLTKQYSHVI